MHFEKGGLEMMDRGRRQSLVREFDVVSFDRYLPRHEFQSQSTSQLRKSKKKLTLMELNVRILIAPAVERVSEFGVDCQCVIPAVSEFSTISLHRRNESNSRILGCDP